VHSCDAESDHGSGIAALIVSGDVAPDVLQPDLMQTEALPAEPSEIAVEVVGVGLISSGCRPEPSCKGIKPELL
jgi:hypothetical protein